MSARRTLFWPYCRDALLRRLRAVKAVKRVGARRRQSLLLMPEQPGLRHFISRCGKRRPVALDGTSLPLAPTERHRLLVGGMLGIHAAQLEFHSAPLQFSLDPAVGMARVRNVRHRRQVDQMDAALVFFDSPDVGVAKDAGFHLTAGAQHFQQRLCVFQSAALFGAEVMMQNHEGGPVLVGVQSAF